MVKIKSREARGKKEGNDNCTTSTMFPFFLNLFEPVLYLFTLGNLINTLLLNCTQFALVSFLLLKDFI